MTLEKAKTIAATVALVVITAQAVYGLYDAAKMIRKESKIKKAANKKD